jgi:hypothetical protein
MSAESSQEALGAIDSVVHEEGGRSLGDMVALRIGSGVRELAMREGDGVEVRLLWEEGNNDALRVTVEDTRNGSGFDIHPVLPDRAMDIFHHPFAEAAYRGLVVLSEVAEVEVPQEKAA